MWSERLEAKIERLKTKRSPVHLGSIFFYSPLILAPMAGICTIPYRLLMQELGAGGTVSELISCHGINFKNERTLEMLKIHPLEDVVGIQLFGEDPESMAKAARVAQEYGPKFLDINMGCPVRKVVTKGGGSALLKNPKELGKLFSSVKKAIEIPLSIKIRTGWDAEGKNAQEVIHVAHEEGVEWVAIHGRTRAQQYTGHADWDYIEKLANESPLPIIGNGDLHHPASVFEKQKSSQCAALMIARGALRNPFIFLEGLDEQSILMGKSIFDGPDYWEVCHVLAQYTRESYSHPRVVLNQFRKLVVWFAAGFPHSAKFRSQIFQCHDFNDAQAITQDYYLSLENAQKHINYQEVFMGAGHG